MATEQTTDICIVGAGCAGMTAAIYAARAGKKVLVLEGAGVGGQIATAPFVSNYPGIRETSGIAFADTLCEQALTLGAEMDFTTVTDITGESGKFTVHTEDGTVLCGAVILATGARHRALGLAGEEEHIGHGVSYCAVCDGAFYKNAEVAVVGGGNAALQSALLLSETCEKVYLVHRRDTFRGEDALVSLLQKRANVEFVLSAAPVALLGEADVDGLQVKETQSGTLRTLSVTGVFIMVGQQPNNEPFANKVQLDDYGYIQAGEDCTTACEGIFAAGDCRTKAVRQLTTAAADGAVSALAACTLVDMLEQ